MTSVQKLEAWRPVLDEDVVDFGIGTLEEQAAAATRIIARAAESEARWLALPRSKRIVRVLRLDTYGRRRRLEHALAALRGVECEP